MRSDGRSWARLVKLDTWKRIMSSVTFAFLKSSAWRRLGRIKDPDMFVGIRVSAYKLVFVHLEALCWSKV